MLLLYHPQVGYGDVVAFSPAGRMAVLFMICVGVVLIPVQTSQLYNQLAARRSIQGMHCPAVLLVCIRTLFVGNATTYAI